MSTTDESDETDDERIFSRREVLGGAVTLAAVGAAGHFSGRAAAQSASGVLASESEPFESVHTGRFRLLGVTSAPSSPSGYATLHYRSDLD
jgi:hypothetical protein